MLRIIKLKFVFLGYNNGGNFALIIQILKSYDYEENRYSCYCFCRFGIG